MALDKTELHASVERLRRLALDHAPDGWPVAPSADPIFRPMATAPRDGTLVLLMGAPLEVPVVGSWETDGDGLDGWCTDHVAYASASAFQGWFPIPALAHGAAG